MSKRESVRGKRAQGKSSTTSTPSVSKRFSDSKESSQNLKNMKQIMTPKSDPLSNIGLNRSLSSMYRPGSFGQIEELPPLSGCPDDQFNERLQQKLQQCRVMCNFADPMVDLKSKQIKRNSLQEILDHIAAPKYVKMLSSDSIRILFSMFKSNIIRAMPPIPDLAKVPMIGDDINDTMFEGAWPHLELVYLIILKFFESSAFDPSSVVQYIDVHFIAQFLNLLSSTDQRERDALKMVLHRIYLRFVQQRSIIRISIQNIFYTYLYETKYFLGINELLEMMLSIIDGYAVPLKLEHKEFLIKILLPLHTSNFLHLFQHNLFYCIVKYIQKDSSLISVIIKEMLAVWPCTCSIKELLYLQEIGKFLEMISDEHFSQLMKVLLRRIGKCVRSDNFQVSEQALLLWKIDRFVTLMQQNAKELFPIICPHLYFAGTNHWNSAIKNLAVSVIRICMESSKDVFEAFSKTMKNDEQQQLSKLSGKRDHWLLISNAGMKFDKNLSIINSPAPLNVIYEIKTKETK